MMSGEPVDGPVITRAQTHADYRLIRRNEPCPCGSGKKFKACHMAQRKPGERFHITITRMRPS